MDIKTRLSTFLIFSLSLLTQRDAPPPRVEQPSEERVREVTNQIVTIYQMRRMQIFQNDAGTLSKLYSNAFSQHYSGPADAIGNNNSASGVLVLPCVSL